MENMTFLELAEKVLAEVKRPLSPSEIWKFAVAQGYHSLLRARQGKTPERTSILQSSPMRARTPRRPLLN